jgi:hypothetical protein
LKAHRKEMGVDGSWNKENLDIGFRSAHKFITGVNWTGLHKRHLN